MASVAGRVNDMEPETISVSEMLTSDDIAFDIAFLAALARELVAQDRAGTVKPVFYQVEQRRRRFGFDGDYADGSCSVLARTEAATFIRARKSSSNMRFCGILNIMPARVRESDLEEPSGVETIAPTLRMPPPPG